MEKGIIANADYALVMHNGQWLKIYDINNQKPNVLWNTPTLFAGYYNRFNHRDIATNDSGTIKLNKPFSKLKNGIEFIFKPKDHFDTCAYFYDGNNNKIDNSLNIMPDYDDIFRISKDDLIKNNPTSLGIGPFRNNMGMIQKPSYSVYIGTNGVDTLYIHDMNGQPTSFIGNYFYDYYLIFDEIDEY
ncbi:hypothetical protein [Apilactobacillus quenuiae]|uniref:hypothetical protein n=1 Tax=Apilactobacillus quenuiae TaxID=2008377 RepID=UPI000D01A574|nr:hypothetical protein [Apilactobacillus quenuiae]